MPQIIKGDKENYGKKAKSWTISEYANHKRDIGWYVVGGIIDLILIIYAFWTHNFLFAVIIIIASFIVILHDSSNPEDIEFSITTSGLILGKKFYDYDEVKDFAVVYKPNKNLKRLYFELKAPFAHRLSIPLQEQDPLPIREHLLKYLLEDLERKDESVSEAFARTFKI